MVIGTSKTSAIKRAQKEAALFRIISGLIHQAFLENSVLSGIFITRVELSPGKTMCTVYFYTPQGKKHFDQVLEDLKLFKPSIRKSISDTMQSRYTVDLMFKFDEAFEKSQRIEQLLDKIKAESDPVNGEEES